MSLPPALCLWLVARALPPWLSRRLPRVVQSLLLAGAIRETTRRLHAYRAALWAGRSGNDDDLTPLLTRAVSSETARLSALRELHAGL